MKPHLIFEASAIVGQKRAVAEVASQTTYAQARCLRDIRKSKAYRQTGLTWDQFCPGRAGITRSVADYIIQCLNEFGEPFFSLCAIVRVSRATFRQIAAHVTKYAIEVDGESISLIPDNTPKIRAAIAKLCGSVRRRHNLSARVDHLLDAATQRARAVPQDQVADLRDLARHAIARWTEIDAMLTPAGSPSISDTDCAR
jgi:hypothetical protein